MEPISIIIMLLGMAVLVALYFMSRSARNNLPQEKDMHIHAIRDEEGRMASSIKEDIPGEDTPVDVIANETKSVPETQLVLFIAARQDEGINGNKLINVLEKIGLQFGDMDIYHRMATTDQGEVSIYTVANGVDPWTLKPDDVRQGSTPGVSFILNLPSSIDDVKAIEDFVEVAQIVAKELGADLKNQKQEIFSDADKTEMLALVE